MATESIQYRDGTTGVVEVPTPPAALAIFAITPEQIKAKAEAYGKLKADTPAGLKSVTAAIAECRTMRVSIGKRKKEVNEDAHARIKAVNALHDELVDLIESFEKPLKAEKERAEKAKAAIRAEADRKEREEYEAKIRKEQEAEALARKAKDEAERKAREAELADRAHALSEEAARVAAEKEKARLDREAADRIAADAKAEADRRQKQLDDERAAFEAEKAAVAAEKKKIDDAKAAEAKAEADRLKKEEDDRLLRKALADAEAADLAFQQKRADDLRVWNEFDRSKFETFRAVLMGLQADVESSAPASDIGASCKKEFLEALFTTGKVLDLFVS